MQQLALLDFPAPPTAQELARAAGEKAAQACMAKAEALDPSWKARAVAWIVDHLERHGPTSGEDLTDGCKAAGIVPHKDKAMGGVIASLHRKKRIAAYGYGPRRKGHGTAGATIWRIVR